LAAITDFFDGLIARKYDLVIEFGKIADPISDKTLILGALISLSLIGEIDSIMAFIILGRDVFVIVGFILASLLVKDYEVKPHFSGKLNALFLMVYLGLIIINASGYFILKEIITFLEILLIVTIILSIYNYLKYPGRAVFKQIF
jgi:CDP-diacylglycerol--glycerol-3-phosphate 3-phosphatidyltransferase